MLPVCDELHFNQRGLRSSNSFEPISTQTHTPCTNGMPRRFPNQFRFINEIANINQYLFVSSLFDGIVHVSEAFAERMNWCSMSSQHHHQTHWTLQQHRFVISKITLNHRCKCKCMHPHSQIRHRLPFINHSINHSTRLVDSTESEPNAFRVWKNKQLHRETIFALHLFVSWSMLLSSSSSQHRSFSFGPEIG